VAEDQHTHCERLAYQHRRRLSDQICLLLLHALLQMVHDTLDAHLPESRHQKKRARKKTSQPFHFQTGEHYFLSDMALAPVDEQMQRFAQQVEQGQAMHASSPPAAPALSAVLQGGAFAYVVADGEDAEAEAEGGKSSWALPHGVDDWTATHHLCSQAGTLTGHAAADADGVSPAMFPLFFHCESHRVGAVNWRLKDVHTAIASRSHSLAEAACISASAGAPAYWLCVDAETENVTLFCRIMAEMTRTPHYSLDQLHPPAIHSIEPLLRAGVCMRLLLQHEHELVVLAPGVPHCVFTPPAATEISRNWATPHSLLAAAVRVLCDSAGERAEWIRILHKQPLCCVLQALRRLRTDQPCLFEQLIAHPQSNTHLRFLLGRAAAPELASSTHQQSERDLQAIARQIAAWMVPQAATEQIVTASSLPDKQRGAVAMDESADESADEGEEKQDDKAQVRTDATDKASPASPTSVALPSSASVARSVGADYAARCDAYRDMLIARLHRECPLSTALHLLQGLLFAPVPLPSVQELCAELTEKQSSTTTVQELHEAVQKAHKQNHPRAAQRQRLAVAEQEVQAVLQNKLQRAKVSKPDVFEKLANLKERLERLLPPAQRQCTSSTFHMQRDSWAMGRG
jgi:hypothetical protein